ncbi:hypothetical protein F7D01_14185 [Erythrobacter sp. 3-20A1M]|nr:hypothetical protein F7D01_14185 [Erythrobacter sp. 3-20A1M]
MRASIAYLVLFAALLGGCSLLDRDDDAPPYWVSVRATEANLRVGPSESYRILWVYHRPGLPMKVVREHEGWRLVRDAEGAQGWMVSRLLTRDRSAIVMGDDSVAMRSEPAATARVKWQLEPGVIGRLGSCEEGWCRMTIGDRGGYVRADALWGAGPP